MGRIYEYFVTDSEADGSEKCHINVGPMLSIFISISFWIVLYVIVCTCMCVLSKFAIALVLTLTVESSYKIRETRTTELEILAHDIYDVSCYNRYLLNMYVVF